MLYHRSAKRLFDLIMAVLALVILSPLLGLIALVLRLTMGRGVLFRQMRPGLGGMPFVMNKYRTMVEKYDMYGVPEKDGDRLTRVGKFLRATSLDEIPELFNVLKGDMSLVGPRPLLMQYLDRYTAEQARRHEVKPGITGWAQVNGRNASTWEKKFELDVWYVDHQSLWLDLKIIAMTIWKIIRRKGINQAGQATAEEFIGQMSR